jgi:hypothetical protein
MLWARAPLSQALDDMYLHRKFDASDLSVRSFHSALRAFAISGLIGLAGVLLSAVIYQDMFRGVPSAVAGVFVLCGLSVPMEMLSVRIRFRVRLFSGRAILPLAISALWAGTAGLLFVAFLWYFRGATTTLGEATFASAACATIGAVISALPAAGDSRYA